MADTTPNKSQVIVLKEFFGFKPNPDGSMQKLPQFKAEVDQLSPQEKDQLATMAAKALGYSQEVCTFKFV